MIEKSRSKERARVALEVIDKGFEKTYGDARMSERKNAFAQYRSLPLEDTLMPVKKRKRRKRKCSSSSSRRRNSLETLEHSLDVCSLLEVCNFVELLYVHAYKHTMVPLFWYHGTNATSGTTLPDT